VDITASKDVIRRCHVAPATRRGQRRVAIPGSDIEHARSGAKIERFAQVLADNLQRRADDCVIG